MSCRLSLSSLPITGKRFNEIVQLVVGDWLVVLFAPEFLPPHYWKFVSGFSVHANVCIPAHDRKRLERLCRYAGRPPVATERLSLLPDGRLLYRLKRPWRDGTSHVILEPLEMIEKLAALVPPPQFNLVRYHGVLAPSAA